MKPRNHSEAIRWKTAAAEAAAYEQEIASTEAGRRSMIMRNEINEFIRQRRAEDAHALTLEMNRIFIDTDDGAAAAAARHDLGRSFSERETGVPLENLEAAILLTRRALMSPARARVAQRRVQSQRQLASLLRKRSEYLDAESAERELAQAERLLRDALEAATAIGPIGLPQVPQLAGNLGNLLHEMGDLDGAVRFHERALEANDVLAKREQRDPDDYARLMLGAADARRARRTGTDLKRAEELLSRTVEMHLPTYSDRAAVLLARSFLDRGEQKRAETTLARVRWAHVPAELIVNMGAQLLRELNDDRWRSLLQKVIDNSIAERAATVADHVADWAVLMGQQATSLMARFFVDDGDNLKAFLLLENSSGLRFGEALRNYQFHPSTELERACLERWRDEGLLAGFFENFIGMTRGAPRELLTQARRAMGTQMAESPIRARFLSRLDMALQHAEPDKAIKAAFDEHYASAAHALGVLRATSPAFRKIDALLHREVTKEDVRDVLQSQADHVLLRLSVSDDDLVAIGLWLEGTELKTGAVRATVPADLQNLVCGTDLPDAALLERLGLTSALPNGKLSTVVLLPSYKALRLPLIAFGPVGSRLVDRADAVVWLPNLVALRAPHAVSPPRAGEWLVTGPRTKLAKTALAERTGTAHRLDGADATPDQVVAASRKAEVLTIYAHGSWDEKPSLHLSGGALEQHHMGPTWHGMERIEIFACESGSARPLDLRAPPTDEGLGLDFEFMKVGVRSAIASMWSVPELSTAAICRQYRALIAEGVAPPAALLRAQRWWLESGATEVLDHEAEGNGEHLAPAPFQAPSTGLRERLLWPTAWAGLRFSGVHGQRPAVVSWEELGARASEKGIAELDRVIAERAKASAVPEDEEKLKGIVGGTHEQVSASTALAVAALYRWRRWSSHEHNLLFGLAWLHEAMPAASEGEGDQLALLAAHLWLDLATCQYRSLRPMTMRPASPVEVTRARHLCVRAGLADRRPDEHAILSARLEIVDDPSAASAEKVWARWGKSFGKASNVESLSVATDVLSMMEHRDSRAVTELLGRINMLVRAEPHGAASAHLAARACSLAEIASQKTEMIPPFEALVPRDAEAVAMYLVTQLRQDDPRRAEIQLGILGEAMSACELPLHGFPSESKSELIRASGVHGRPYHRLLGIYLWSMSNNHENASQALAALELASNHRTGVRHKIAHFTNLAGVRDSSNPFSDLANRQGLVDAALRCLQDQAVLPNFPQPDQPHPLDPFSVTPEEIKERAKTESSITAWSLADNVTNLARAAEGRTAAFRAIRAAERTRSADAHIWEEMQNALKAMKVQEGAGSQAAAAADMAPVLRLEAIENDIQEITHRGGLLGLHLDSAGRLAVTSSFPSRDGIDVRHVAQQSVELTVFPSLLFVPEEAQPLEPRQKTWERVRAALDPLLESVLPAEGEPVDWLVLAPGLLRPLPLLGLTAGGRPILDRVRSLAMIPSLSFLNAMPTPAANGVACLHVASTTGPLTSAVVRSLRALRPPARILDPNQLNGRMIVESDAMGAFATSMASLRIVSEGDLGLNDTTSTFKLEGDRHFRPENVPVELACRTVGLWASTSGLPDSHRAAGVSSDGMPEIVCQFLASGAQGVIDLAWPVSDLVRALVLELYSVLAWRQGDGPPALSQAVRMVQHILTDWPDEVRNQGTMAGALCALDVARATLLESVGFLDATNEHAFVELRPLADQVNEPLDVFVARATDPTALAAFRYWGF